ncbi:Imm6 family immunity protein [Ruminococcus albus]|uniref:Immunity protein Imm6 n=1 Tax=Ruminococcus albus TaxID=1264 RepID=A0A1I1MLL8_RUMAL|nr:Imm6 family immunity protein [Ruminococcus albus]SFC86347.1 Immunity protein Imm6 [Ruminococcus albus]
MIEYAAEYLLKITKRNSDMMGSQCADYCLSLIEKIVSKKYTANDLYSFVTEEDGIYTLAESATNKDEEDFRQAFLSVSMCIIRAKYRDEGQKYLPEDIESIQAEKIDGFFAYLKNEEPEPKDCYTIFCDTVCL